MGTYSAKTAELQHDWLLIDAEGLVLGRLASYVANRLRGKHKAMFTPNMDTGDHVVIVNAEKVVLTGNKRTQRVYYRHTGHPGGIKGDRADKVLDGRFPERVIQKAIERMITRGPLGRDVMRKLHVYKGAEHPHQAQSPAKIDFASLNAKNTSIAA